MIIGYLSTQYGSLSIDDSLTWRSDNSELSDMVVSLVDNRVSESDGMPIVAMLKRAQKLIGGDMLVVDGPEPPELLEVPFDEYDPDGDSGPDYGARLDDLLAYKDPLGIDPDLQALKSYRAGQLAKADGQFDESKYQRDSSGKFSSTGGGENPNTNSSLQSKQQGWQQAYRVAGGSEQGQPPQTPSPSDIAAKKAGRLMVERGTIDLNKRPLVNNTDGSISTVRSISIEQDGKVYLIPTVSPDGKVVSDDDAVKIFQETGKHLGAFKNERGAQAYAIALHRAQARQYAKQKQFRKSVYAAGMILGLTKQFTHAGLAIMAEDTGRTLMLQRAMTDEDDPAKGQWEYPGGGIEPGELPYEAACREWCEEVGVEIPENLKLVATWESGIYCGHIATVPSEGDIEINSDREVINPDDPDGDITEVVAWWFPDDIEGNAACRRELVDSYELFRPKLPEVDLMKSARAVFERSMNVLKARAPKGFTESNPLVINGIEYIGGRYIPNVSQGEVDRAAAEQNSKPKQQAPTTKDADTPEAPASNSKPTFDDWMAKTRQWEQLTGLDSNEYDIPFGDYKEQIDWMDRFIAEHRANNAKQGWEPESDTTGIDHPDYTRMRKLFMGTLKAADLPISKKKEFATQIQAALQAMPPEAMTVARSGLEGIDWYNDEVALTRSVGRESLLVEDKVILGCYRFSGSMGELHLDGGGADIYAHELAHAADWTTSGDDRASGKGQSISSTPEWLAAFELEIKNGSISDYGATSPAEGFAEFARAVWGYPELHEQLKKSHPKSWSVFEKYKYD